MMCVMVDVITSCAERIVTAWPPSAVFTHVGAVKTFLANRCPDINAMTFAGVKNDVFRGYVLFHAARMAWEGRRFEMRYMPGGWKRVPMPVKLETLRGNIIRSLL